MQIAAAANDAALRNALNVASAPAPAIPVLRGYNHLFWIVENNDPFDDAALGTPFAPPVPDLVADSPDEAIALTP